MGVSSALRAVATLLPLALFAATPVRGQTCPPGNLAAGAPVQEPGQGAADAQRLTDGRTAVEGAAWNDPAAVVLAAGDPLLVDLRRALPLRALSLQADHDDLYVVEGSADGSVWGRLWRAPALDQSGLRTRAARLARTASVRYLRLSAAGGEEPFAVSELEAYCELPDPWPPLAARGTGGALLTRTGVQGIKAAIAVLGLALFGWGIALRRAGRPEADRRLRDALLLGLGLLAALGWWNLGKLHFGQSLHTWDFYHYYMGAKYSGELGYTRLYACTAVADAEDGWRGRVERRRMRDLASNRIGSTAAILAAPRECRRHFSPERWRAFKADLSWFRERMSPQRWDHMQRDHGYNATPVWELAGAGLANLAPASERSIRLLALIDPLLLLAMWACVLWAFGWRAMCVGLLWWGTNHLGEYAWTGGAFLRQDWLVASVVGVCLVRRGWMVGGGFALAGATLLRVFPGFIVAALVLKALLQMWQARSWRPSPEHLRFAAGCLAAIALLLPLSAVLTGGAGWSGFIDNSRTYLGTPGGNTVGLKMLLSYDHATRRELTRNTALEDPDRDWTEARRSTFQGRGFLHALLVLGFLVLLGRAARSEEDWVVLVLGAGLIFVASAPASYYASVLLLLGLLPGRRGETAGALLCALSAWSWLAVALWSTKVEFDERFTWISLATLAVVAVATSIRPRASRAGSS